MSPSVASDLNLSPQAKTILCHLRKHGHITPMKALINYNICAQSLARAVWEMRHWAGYGVRTKRLKDDAGHRYANYSLAPVA
jgi:Helix-turn-helix domain